MEKYSDTIQKGDIYYAVGALQHGCIEQWQYTGDRYDLQRIEMNNIFKTADDARLMLEYMQKFSPVKEELLTDTSSNVNIITEG